MVDCPDDFDFNIKEFGPYTPKVIDDFIDYTSTKYPFFTIKRRISAPDYLAFMIDGKYLVEMTLDDIGIKVVNEDLGTIEQTMKKLARDSTMAVAPKVPSDVLGTIGKFVGTSRRTRKQKRMTKRK